MDCRLTDAFADPVGAGHERYCTETLYRLPTALPPTNRPSPLLPWVRSRCCSVEQSPSVHSTYSPSSPPKARSLPCPVSVTGASRRSCGPPRQPPSVNQSVVPTPASLCAQIRPRWRRQMRWATASPIPTPGNSLSLCIRWNGANSLSA